MLLNKKIPFSNDYNWDYFLNFRRLRQVEAMEWIKGDTYGSTYHTNGLSGWFAIAINNQESCFNISIEIMDQKSYPLLEEKIKGMLGLSYPVDIGLIEQKLKHNTKNMVIEKGLHIPGILTVFEACLRAICGQQVSIAAATNLVGTLVRNCNLLDKEKGLYFFPKPEDILRLNPDQIKTTKAKIQTLYALSTWFVSNGEPADINSLLAIKGIGPWTVDYIKLRAKNDPDIWMGSDLAIKKILKTITISNMHAIEPYKSYLSLHLWNNIS